MVKNLVNYAEVGSNLVTVAGKSNKVEALVGTLIGILDDQPVPTAERGRPVLDVSIYGIRYRFYTFRKDNGAIRMRRLVETDMVVGYFANETTNSCIAEAFQTLPRPPTH